MLLCHGLCCSFQTLWLSDTAGGSLECIPPADMAPLLIWQAQVWLYSHVTISRHKPPSKGDLSPARTQWSVRLLQSARHRAAAALELINMPGCSLAGPCLTAQSSGCVSTLVSQAGNACVREFWQLAAADKTISTLQRHANHHKSCISHSYTACRHELMNPRPAADPRGRLSLSGQTQPQRGGTRAQTHAQNISCRTCYCLNTTELLVLSMPGCPLATPVRLIMLDRPPPPFCGAVGSPMVGPYSTDRLSRHR